MSDSISPEERAAATIPTIRIAEGLTVPLDQTPQPIALIGRRGSGKTYAAGKLTEEFLDAGLQVVVLDPVGTWYSLRLMADGKTPAYSIPVLGGSHGDIPLEASAGKLIAQFVAEKGLSIVLDVSEFTGADQRRFVAGFAQELLQAKKRHKSALMLVMEEAQEFAPQMARGDVATMLGAVEKVVKLGRNFGIVPVLVSQRPQSVNKDVLNQTELLLTFQLTGPQERKTVDGWVQEKGADRSVVGELPGLPVGTALVWSPQWLNVFGRFAIDRKKTFDASATPGAAPVAAASLSDIDLEAVRTAMAATIEKAKADDPRELRKRIVELERELRKSVHSMQPETKEPEIRIERVEVPVFSEADEERIAGLEATLQDVAGKLGDMAADVALLRSQVREARQIEHGKGGVDSDTQGSPKRVRPSVTRGYGGDTEGPRSLERDNRGFLPPRAGATPAPSQPSDDITLRAGARRILDTLARHYPMRMTRAQLGTLAKFKVTGGTFQTYWSNLKRAGYVVEQGGEIVITEAGLDAAGVSPGTPASTEELLDMWRSALRAGARKMLDILVESYPEGMSRDELAERVDMTATGGTFQTYLSDLRRNGLADVEGGLVRASDTLFVGVGA